MVFLILAIILFLVKNAQQLMQKLNLPVVAGEILLGIALGPTLIVLLALDGSGESILSSILYFPEEQIELTINIIFFISEVAVLLLLFQVGLEMDIKSLKRTGRGSFLTALGGMILPFSSGFFLVFLISDADIIPPGVSRIDVALFLAATLTATSIGISIRIFIELDKIHAPAAKIMVGAAVIDDILAILLLTVSITYVEEETATALFDMITVFLTIVAFFVFCLVFGIFVLPRIIEFISNEKDRYMPITLGLVLLFFFSWLASSMHLAPIIGAFIAGMLINSNKEIAHKVEEQISPMNHWIVPVFFIAVGLRVNLWKVFTIEIIVIAIVIILVAILSKVIGSGLGAFASKSSLEDSYLIGLAMSARGEVVLIFSAVALDLGIFSTSLYSSLVMLVVVTSLIIPIWLRFSFQWLEGKETETISLSKEIPSNKKLSAID
jgi:Kef-type K+ transport system membrane component KefB